jgi:pyruvate dehydrogenase E1 component alpha subunit
MTLNDFDLLSFYKVALRIRQVEQEIARRYPEGEMRCPVHLSIGQESPSALFSLIQETSDTAISTHRAHAHYLAKNGNLNKMIAEIYGKVTGCSKGRGGSMHLVDLAVNFLGSSAIVGNSIPIGVGSAYAHKLMNSNAVSFIFLGDGAVEEGSFYESANFAAVHKLPAVFVCENNFYSVYTDLQPRQPLNRSISNLAKAIGLNAASVDSFGYEQSFEVFRDLTNYARTGNGPVFIELFTYRTLEHCGPFDDDDLNYRLKSELDELKNKDVLAQVETELVTKNLIGLTEIERIKAAQLNEIKIAFSRAQEDPFPKLSDILDGVYAKS